jgi:adenylosuccinate synthase
VGWFDAVATRHGCLVQGATDVAMTNLDVLSYLDEIPVCVAYELDGERIHHFPATPALQQVKPVYEIFKGWKTDIRGETDYSRLPQACRDYVERIEGLLGTPITILSTGPRREEICYREAR